MVRCPQQYDCKFSGQEYCTTCSAALGMAPRQISARRHWTIIAIRHLRCAAKHRSRRVRGARRRLGDGAMSARLRRADAQGRGRLGARRAVAGRATADRAGDPRVGEHGRSTVPTGGYPTDNAGWRRAGKAGCRTKGAGAGAARLGRLAGVSVIRLAIALSSEPIRARSARVGARLLNKTTVS
jgi:hypothetical protein